MFHGIVGYSVHEGWRKDASVSQFFAAVILSFLVGSVPTAYLFAKWIKNVDIREFGSGNVGATNAARVLGKKIGFIVLLIDFLKGTLPILIVSVSLDTLGFAESTIPWIGLAAILGHVFTPFMNFRGGKGIATGAGVISAAFPVMFVIVSVAWISVFLFSRIVSLSSLVALGVLLISGLVQYPDIQTRLFFVITVALAVWTHRSNIGRLTRGEEKKIG